MANTISILVKAEDQASSTLKKVAGNLDDTSKSAGAQSSLVDRLSANWGTFAAISAGAGVAMYGLFGQMQKANEEAKRLQTSLAGLSSVARAFDQDVDAANRAARDLASDGLMTVADAAIGLKNLLASGYGLAEAEQLMRGLKDQAVNNRQAYYDLGGAVRATTEGIRNGNSVLADATGTTKNLSVIAKEAGISVDQMGSISSNTAYRQAVLNAFLQETGRSAGDAARYLETAAGQEAYAAAQATVLYQRLGTALQPALLALLQTLTPIIVGVADWVSKNQQLTAALVIGTGVVLGLIAVMGTLATAIVATRTVMATLGPTAIGATGVAKSAFMGLRALVASPLAMPAIAVAAAIASLHQVIGAVNAVRGAINALNNAADAKAASISAENDAIQKIKNSNQSAEWKARKINEILKYSARAMGGPVAQGTSYLVGENGPEVFTPNSSGTISPNGASGGTTINISGTINIATPQAADAFWNRIDKTQRLAKVGMA